MKNYIKLIVLFFCFPAVAEDSWDLQISGTTENLTAIFFHDANNGFIVGNSGTVLNTVNGGTTWSSLNVGTSDNLANIYFKDVNNGFILSQTGKVLSTSVGGSSWSSQTIFSFGLNGIDFNGSNGIIVGDNGSTFTSSNNGVSWTPNISLGVFTLNDVAFLNDTLAVAVGANGNVYKTTDKGTNWSNVNVSSTSTLTSIEKISSSSFFICGTGGEIIEYNALNNVSSKLSVGLSTAWLKDLSCDNLNCYITGTNKTSLIYSSGTWISRSLDDNVNLNAVSHPSSGIVYVCGIGGVIYKSSAGGFPISTQEIAKNKISIFPNPVESFITISNDQPFSSYEIIASNGISIVKQISNSTKTVINVSELPTGLYLVRIESNNEISTTKFLKK